MIKPTPTHLAALAAAPDEAYTLTAADTKVALGLSEGMLDYHVFLGNLTPRKLTIPPRYRPMRYFHPADIARFERDRRKRRKDSK